MKSIQNARLAYSAGKFVLAIGTVVVLLNVAVSLVPDWSPILQGCVALFVVAVLLPLLDGAWDYLEDALRSMNGQSPTIAKSTLVLYFVLGFLGISGSMFLSIISAQIISDAVVTDQSGQAREIENAKAQGDASYLKLVASAERAIASAEKQVQIAQENEGKAEKQAVAAIGGDFARLWNSGNAWVRTAPETSANRRKVQKAIQAAQAKTAQAQQSLSQAQATYSDVLTTGRAESSTATAAVVQAHTVVLNKWLSDLKNSTWFIIRIDIAAGVLSLLLLFLLYRAKEIPDDRTLMEVFTKAVRLSSDAIVYALGVGVDAAERGAKNAGLVAHPLPGMPVENPATMLPVAPPVLPSFVAPDVASDVAEIQAEMLPAEQRKTVAPGQQKQQKSKATTKATDYEKLRRIVAQYKRRSLRGELSEKGQQTLVKYERKLQAMKNK